MTKYANRVGDLIAWRYSCRTYKRTTIAEPERRRLCEFLANNTRGPWGSRARFALVTAVPQDRFGTYGYVRGAPAFIVGAVEQATQGLEEYGYLLECAVLAATDLDLGTCWLGGGSFTKSSFARRIAVTAHEIVPAVAAIGNCTEGARPMLRRREWSGATRRFPPERVFFRRQWGESLNLEEAGPYAEPLEAVRRAPSANNKQPWRIIGHDNHWHFYLERTRGYGKESLLFRLLGIADLQRVDMGIAMCHFELTAREVGLGGQWTTDDPGLVRARPGIQYVTSWKSE